MQRLAKKEQDILHCAYRIYI